MLVAFFLVSTLVVGLLHIQQQAIALNPKKLPTPYTPSKEFLDYINAPAITQEQKDNALKIASTSDVFKQYIKYPHGPINVVWSYPYTGAIHMSTIIDSETSQVYGLLSLNIDNGMVKNAGFSNWRNYW
jgi:hypothetical protein